MSEIGRKSRARLAGLTARLGPGAPKTLNAKRDHYALTLEEHIRKVVDEAPPLTVTQRDRLKSLLDEVPVRRDFYAEAVRAALIARPAAS